mmetsp:Transcript_10136/g.27068  ORF Transcript_10136/g.27068 Transcript_10136/m.27068 type:complete len:388 (-) Transcript_10136:199-1362(-)
MRPSAVIRAALAIALFAMASAGAQAQENEEECACEAVSFAQCLAFSGVDGECSTFSDCVGYVCAPGAPITCWITEATVPIATQSGSFGIVPCTAVEASNPQPLWAAWPSVIEIGTGVRLEGITRGPGTFVYVGSLAGEPIRSVDVTDGTVSPATPALGTTVGLYYEPSNRVLYAAGGPAGQAYAFDMSNGGALLSSVVLPGSSFVNDVVVDSTVGIAYFTNSFSNQLYGVQLAANGAFGAVFQITLGGEWVQPPAGTFAANGIDKVGNSLIVAKSDVGALYSFARPTSATTVAAVRITGVDLPNCDGIRHDPSTGLMYVVQNRLNKVAVLSLSPTLDSAVLVREIMSPQFDVPTTVAVYRDFLYLPNARFGAENPGSIEYSVVRVPK